MFLLINLIAVCIAASFLLRLNYTLLLLIDDTDYEGGTLVNWISEYIGFVGMNILDFVEGLAFLYLFHAMGVNEKRKVETPKELSGMTSINNVLEQEDYQEMLQNKSSSLRHNKDSSNTIEVQFSSFSSFQS